jgi:hypothetical protein
VVVIVHLLGGEGSDAFARVVAGAAFSSGG